MTETTSDFLIKRITEWGLKRIYGYPGDGINGIIGAIDRAGEQDRLRAGAARRNGRVHGVRAFANSPAKSASVSPLPGRARSICSTASTTRRWITSRSSRSSDNRRARRMGGDYQQEVDLISLFKDVAHEYVHMASTPAQMRHLVDRAIRIAQAERTVTCIIIPNDVQELEAVETPPRKHGTVHSGIGYTGRRASFPKDARSAPRRGGSQRRQESGHAGRRRRAAARPTKSSRSPTFSAPASPKRLLGKAVVPDDLPFVHRLDRSARHASRAGT